MNFSVISTTQKEKKTKTLRLWWPKVKKEIERRCTKKKRLSSKLTEDVIQSAHKVNSQMGHDKHNKDVISLISHFNFILHLYLKD